MFVNADWVFSNERRGCLSSTVVVDSAGFANVAAEDFARDSRGMGVRLVWVDVRSREHLHRLKEVRLFGRGLLRIDESILQS